MPVSLYPYPLLYMPPKTKHLSPFPSQTPNALDGPFASIRCQNLGCIRPRGMISPRISSLQQFCLLPQPLRPFLLLLAQVRAIS